MRQLTLVDIEARIARLGQLEKGFAWEVGRQRGAETVLLLAERRQYLKAIQDALAGAKAARVVLAGVVRRMEGKRGRPRRRVAPVAPGRSMLRSM
jgi:hypothetical protein